jgi:hypothetical protein
METFFYPVVAIENEEELQVVTGYCDEFKIDFQFLDNDLNNFPAQVLLYIDKDDFKLFLKSIGEEN